MKKKIGFGHIVNDIPLNYKFLLIYIVGILLPIVVINFLFMDRISGMIKEREEQNLQISLERARKDIHSLIDGGVAVSHALMTDKTLYEVLEHPYRDYVEFYDAFNEQLRHRVNSYIPVNNQIERIGIYTDNPTIVQGSNYHALNQAVRNSAWFSEWEAYTGEVLVTAYREPFATNPSVTSPYLSVIEEMAYYDTYNTFQKLLRIDFDLNRIYDILVRERDYLDLYLVNGNNEVIVSAETGYQSGETTEYPQQYQSPEGTQVPEEHIVNLGSASYIKGWKLIGIPQGTRVNRALLDMQLYVGLLAGSITLFTLFFIYVMLRSYNYRVKRLNRHMQKVTNEKFDLIRMNEGRDEIGQLIRNFNMMTSEIHSLINNVYKLEIQQKSMETERVRAELNLLQSQMNPHFLFNTLNALLVVSTKNNYTDVKDIIKGLSKLLRRLLNWKDDLVLLEEEMAFTQMYLEIEKFRFRDKFEYRLSINPETLHYKIPKMTIQQLAENACKHGIQAIEGLGVVSITVSATEDKLRIVVADNGKGIGEERLKEILRSVHSKEESGKNIGIRNVYRRLELYYNDSVTFNIASRVDEGTEISYEIPLRMLERQDAKGGPDHEI